MSFNTIMNKINHNEFDIIIRSGGSEKNYWRDLWRYRELFFILSWRDLKVRYKQTVIGAAWGLIRPLITTVIFTIVFNKVANLQTNSNTPYSLMVFAGMLPWYFFSNTISEASNSLIGNSNLITKVYFPRIIVPVSTIMTGLVDFLVSFFLLLLLFYWYGFLPPIQIIFLPFLLVILVLLSIGISLFLTAINVKYRDFRYVIPFLVQLGLYITPIGFSSTIVNEKYRFLYALNPMVGVIDAFRWALLGDGFNLKSFVYSFIVAVVLFVIGVTYFRKFERSFSDNI